MSPGDAPSPETPRLTRAEKRRVVRAIRKEVKRQGRATRRRDGPPARLVRARLPAPD